MPSRLKASFYTLGCRLNQAETAIIQNGFRQNGYDIVDFGERADVCVINSCTVTEQADAKCRQVVRQALRRNPDTFIAVVGCYSQTGAEALSRIEGIDLIVGNEKKMAVIDLIDAPIKRAAPEIVRAPIRRTPFTIEQTGTDLPTTRANLKIQDGCDFMCSFCVIPFARGRARSRMFWDIQREALQLVDAGYQELVLTGVNVGTYRNEGKLFLDIVRMLLTIPGLRRLRISSIEPTTIPEELLDLMADSDVLCSHLHIPVQSGSDAILQAMKRNHTLREFADFVERAAKKVPDILLGTDLMVGFPGESEADFAASCELLQNLPLAYAHVFTYSERAGTAAARMSDKVAPGEKKQRSKILHRISEQEKIAFYRRFIGREVRVLVEEQGADGYWLGFSDNYLKVRIVGKGLAENQLVSILIRDVQNGIALGEPVQETSHAPGQTPVQFAEMIV